MQEVINKGLTKVLGECWHTFEPIKGSETWCEFKARKVSLWKCKDCGEELELETSEDVVNFMFHNDFYTWKGFGKLKERLFASKYKQDFLSQYGYHYREAYTGKIINSFLNSELIDPERFAKVVFDYLQEKEIK